MAVTEATKRARRKWNMQHRKSLSCSVSLDEYESFKGYAESKGKTVSSILLETVRKCVAEYNKENGLDF